MEEIQGAEDEDMERVAQWATMVVQQGFSKQIDKWFLGSL